MAQVGVLSPLGAGLGTFKGQIQQVGQLVEFPPGGQPPERIAMQWFRLYTDILTDWKLKVSLSRENTGPFILACKSSGTSRRALPKYASNGPRSRKAFRGCSVSQ